VDPATLDPEVAAAVDAATADVARHRHSGAAWGRLGMVLLAHDLFPEALVCFQHAQRLESSEVRWPYYRAVILLVDRPDEAIAVLRQAAASKEDDWSVRFRLAETLLERERLQEAGEHLAQVRARRPTHPRVLLRMGQLTLRKGDAAGSVLFLTQAAQHPLSRKAASVALVEAYHRLGQEEQAVQARRQALESAEDRSWSDGYMDELRNLRVGASGRSLRAQTLLAEGAERTARELLVETAKKYPEYYQAHALLAARYFQTGDLKAAEHWLKETVRVAPDFERARIQLGLVLLLRGNPAAAIAEFRTVLASNPGSADAHFYLGQALLAQSDLDGVVATCQEGLRYRPDFAELHLLLSKALVQKGQQAEARRHLQDAIQLSPTNPVALKLIQELQTALGTEGTKQTK
jgi:tetratricopeptide (TPR) repeat protein